MRDTPFSVVNKGRDPLQAVLTVTGVPDGPRPAGGDGFEIERKYYTLDGQEVATAQVGQNERFIVVLKVREINAWPSRLLVADLLPAGLEIDNPGLMGSADLKAFPWLTPSTHAAHLEFRDDRFVAALDRNASDGRDVTLAYMVRAVTPGNYAPAARACGGHVPASPQRPHRDGPDRGDRTAAVIVAMWQAMFKRPGAPALARARGADGLVHGKRRAHGGFRHDDACRARPPLPAAARCGG